VVTAVLHISAGPAATATGRDARNAAGEVFVAGPENRLLRVACESLAAGNRARLADWPQPLVAWGPAGSGKSLLARAVAHSFKSQPAAEPVAAASGADFAREFAHACQADDIARWRRKWSAAALVVIDNVDQLAGKLAAQRELNLALDSALSHGGKALLTLNDNPAAAPALTPALASRLCGGLVLPLAMPDLDARREILRYWADAQRLPLTPEALEWLAAEYPVSAGDLRAIVTRLAAARKLADHPEDGPKSQATPLSRARLERALHAAAVSTAPTLATIARAASRWFRIPLKELRGPSRRRGVAVARGVAMLLARRYTDHSLLEIGRHFGRRDHTTVLHACRAAEARIAGDPALQKAWSELSAKLTVPATQ